MRKISFMIAAMLLTCGLMAQNHFNFTYGSGFSSTSSSLSFNYNVSCSDLLTSTGSGGKIYGRVTLLAGVQTYYIGSFHHGFGWNSSSVSVNAPVNYTENPFNVYPPSVIVPSTPGSTVTMPVNTTCIPVGTYTVRLEIYTNQLPSPELPHNAIPNFTVGSNNYSTLSMSHPHPGGLLIDALLTEYIGGGNIGTFTVSSGGGSISGSRSVTAGTCSSHPVINTTTTGGTSPYTLYYWESSSSPFTAASISSASASISIPNATQGNYQLQLVDANGCRWNNTAVTVKPTMTVNVTPSNQTVCKGACVSFGATSGSGGTGFSYNWQHSNASTAPHTIKTTATFCAVPPFITSLTNTPNTYTVTMSNAYCSGSNSTIQTVTQTCNAPILGACCSESPGGPAGRFSTSEDEPLVDIPLKLFPNPTTGNVLNIQFNNVEYSNAFVEVYDAMGKLVKKMSISKGMTSMELDISNFSQGMYMVHLVTSGKVVYSEKFIRNL